MIKGKEIEDMTFEELEAERSRLEESLVLSDYDPTLRPHEAEDERVILDDRLIKVLVEIQYARR